jgi:diacylglycerol O-acyltransferase
VPLPMLPTDSVFLTAETRQTPMHVGGLQLFKPAPDFEGTHELFRRLTAEEQVAPLFAKRARRSLGTGGQWAWERDSQFDIEHHVRHNALPKPGRVLELLALCSRLHGTLLDRKRPLWEFHLIEGLNDGRFAIYFKMHHALIDGVSAQRLLQTILTRDPAVRDLPAPWAVQRQATATRRRPGLNVAALRGALDLAVEAAGLPGVLAGTLSRSAKDLASPVSFAAPRTMFNVPISGARRFAAQSWPMERVSTITRSAKATVNDVVLAVCSGALRRYLQQLDALPPTPLIAMVPVALKVRERDRESGNAVGAVMCNLATTSEDPADRLEIIRESMLQGKQALSEMTPLQIVAMTGLGMSPLILQGIPGYHELFRPPFNIIISNVPGPRAPLYLNGAELDGLYPLSIPYHGQALNITCTTYRREIAFGLTGCRRTVPHLQRLLGYLDDEFAALEKALGIG